MAQKLEKSKTDEKPKKDEKSVVRRQASPTRPKIIQAIRNYFTEMIGELRKVSWPSRKEALNLTKVVLFVMFAMGAFLGLLDFIYSWIFTLILS